MTDVKQLNSKYEHERQEQEQIEQYNFILPQVMSNDKKFYTHNFFSIKPKLTLTIIRQL